MKKKYLKITIIFITYSFIINNVAIANNHNNQTIKNHDKSTNHELLKNQHKRDYFFNKKLNNNIMRCLWYKKITKNNEHKITLYKYTSVDNNAIYTTNDIGDIQALDMQGITLWKNKIHLNKISTISNYKMFLIISSIPGDLVVINKNNGQILWKTKLPGCMLTQPVCDNVFIYSRTHNDKIVSNNLINGNMIWQTNIHNQHYVSKLYKEFSPIIYKNSLIVEDSIGNIYKIKNNGQKTWKKSILRNHGKYNLIKSEFNCNITSKFLEKNILYIATLQNNLIKFNIENNIINWQIKTPVITNFVINNNTIFTINNNEEIVAYDKYCGKIIWNQNILKNKQPSSIICAGKYIFTGDKKGDITIFHANTGKYISHISTKSGKIYDIIKYKETIIAQTEYGYIYVFSINKY